MSDDPLRDDMERLADIGDEILAGTPIGDFDLAEHERGFVLAYTRKGVENALGPADAAKEKP
jgi:hypothetical protein